MNTYPRTYKDTVTGSSVDTKGFVRELIKETNIDGNWHVIDVTANDKIILVMRTELVSFTSTPLINETKIGTTIYVDIREFISPTKAREVIEYPSVVRNDIMVHLYLTNALYMLNTIDEDHFANRLLTETCVLYTQMVAGVLSSRLTLNPADHSAASVIVAAYIYTSIKRESKFDPVTMKLISKISGVDLRLTKNILDDMEPMYTLNGLCISLASNTTNLLLKNVTPATIIELVQNMWYGDTTGLYMGIALEYPPYWLALLTTLAETSTFKRSTLGDMVSRSKKKNDPLKARSRELYNRIPDENLLRRV